MPLPLLLILVIGGISAITLLLHLLGKSRLAFLTAGDARNAWHRHFPDDDIQNVTVAQNGHAALVRTDQGPGLLWSFGADTVGRHLHDFDLIETPDHLRVIFHDFTAPRVSLHLTETERSRWQELMAPT